MAKKRPNTINGKQYYTRTVCGKKLYSTISQADVDAKAAEYKKLVNRSVRDPNIRVADFVVQWYEDYKDDIGEHTADQYYYCCQVIIKYLGRYKLVDTTPMILETEMKAFASTRLKTTGNYPSQKYIGSIISVLKLIYKRAKKERLIDYNYAEDISVKSKQDRSAGSKRRSLSTEEINQVLNFQHQYTPMVWFMLLCGLMPEEMTPLQWKDILFNEKDDLYLVDINKTALLRSDRKAVVRLGEAKTEFRLRTVPIPYPLSDWVAQEIQNHHPNDLLFPGKDHDVLSKSALSRRFQTYLTDLDCHITGKQKFNPHQKFQFSIEKFCMYDLRHTYITLLVSIDTPVRKTTALAGHSGTETADKYYIDYRKVSTNNDVKRLGDYLRDKVKSAI